MFCPKCGAQNADGSQFCSSCGAGLVQTAAPAPAAATVVVAEKTSGMAVAALVMGIVSFLLFGPLAILAIIFGAIGISQASKPNVKGKGMAVTGLILGIVGGGFWIIMLIFWSSFWWFL
jgi:uncharacterized membrane protein YvbJ